MGSWVGWLVSRFASWLHDLLPGRLDRLLGGWLIGGSVGWLVLWSLSGLVGWLAGRMAFLLAGQTTSWSIGRMFRWSAGLSVGWLTCQLVSRPLVRWFVSQVFGCLVNRWLD